MGETTYEPSRGARILGGFQWMATALVVFFGVKVSYQTYMLLTRGWIRFNWGIVGAPLAVVAFVAGYLWVVRTAPDSATTAERRSVKRLVHIVLIVAFPFLWDLLIGVFQSLDVISERTYRPLVGLFSMVVPSVLWLCLPILLVYGLGIRPLFSDEVGDM